MSLLENGKLVCDPWLAVGDDEPMPGETPAILTLARLRQDPGLLDDHSERVGVLVTAGTQAADITDLLNRIALVAVPFTKFRDGRGFTLARSLREQHAFEGEIRAVGHLLPDQYEYLLRCGFSTVEVPDGKPLEPWQRALAAYTVAYQPAAAPDARLSLLRRHVRAADGAEPA